MPAARSPAVPTAAVALTPSARCLFGHAVDGDDRPFKRLRDDLAAGVNPLAEAGHLGPVHDAFANRPSAPRSATWNLIELVPTSITA